jgi:hypothetical protein
MNADIIQSARHLVDVARAQQLDIRLLGGVAVALHCPESNNPGRSYRDIDAFIPARTQSKVSKVLTTAGYVADQEFNLLNGDTRLLFHDPRTQRQIDVFVGKFAMCHSIPLTIGTDPYTVPIAELLLTKLQIYELNAKDAYDGCALLSTLHIGTAPSQQATRARIAALCGADWGLWRTFTMNLDRCTAYAKDNQSPDAPTVMREVAALTTFLAAAPKSLAFKTRALVGDNVRWYELPEEVER